MKTRAIESPPLKLLKNVLIAWAYSPSAQGYASRDEMNVSINGIGNGIGNGIRNPLTSDSALGC